MYDTGLREGEVVLLDEEDLRLQHDQPHIFVPPEKQKRQPKGRPRKAARMTFDFETTAQKVTVSWRSGSALCARSGSNEGRHDRNH